jgi:predicted dehydrogenase
MARDLGKDPLRVGWVGAGFVGQVGHLANYVDISEADVIALAELRPNLGHDVCERYGIPRYYEDHTALLKDPDVEAVVVIVRRHHTASVALDVLNAGFHTFTEKPMAATFDQAERLVEAADKNDLRYAVGFMRRHDEGVQIAKKMLDELRESNELGPVLSARFYCYFGGDYCNIGGFLPTDEPRPEHLILPLAPDWMPDELHLEYEHFLNVASHDLNLIRFLTNTRPRVSHVEYHRTKGSVAVLDFGDFPGAFEWGAIDQNRWEEGVEIYFSRGRLRLTLPPAFLRNHPASVEIYKDNGKGAGETIRPNPDWTWSFRRQHEAFIRNVADGTEPLASGQDALEDMCFIEEMWRKIL